MAERPPQFLTISKHRDEAHPVEHAARWTLVALLAALAVAALVGLFGQRDRRSAATGGGATLAVDAPVRLRGGLFYQGRFTIRAQEDVDKATLVLDRGWMENTSINTIEPSPVGEASRDGKLALDFGHVPAGHSIVVFMEFQVNPTNVGRRSQDAGLYDDERLLAAVDRTVTIFP